MNNEIEINNNLEKNLNQEIIDKQKNFLETNIGQIINTGINVGIKYILPDFIENEIINLKDNFIKYGIKDGINRVINSSIDLRKLTEKFENINQIQKFIEKGEIISETSNLIDVLTKKLNEEGKISNKTANIIKEGKKLILDNISVNIESMFKNQIKSLDKLSESNLIWQKYYNSRDFMGMEKEYEKIKSELNNIIPLEKVIKETREIENLHKLIENNGKKFDINKNEMEVAKRLV